MANKLAIKFWTYIQGDGTSTSFTINFLTGPVGFLTPAGSLLSPGFDISSTLPTGITGLASSGGETVTLTSLILGVAMCSLESAIPSGEIDYIYGTLLF